MRPFLAAAGFLIFCSGPWLQAQGTAAGGNFLTGDFEAGTLTYNPWAGVDDSGDLHLIPGSQLAVSETGQIGKQAFSPSAAIGDLNGDGLPDVVAADARGFFWYFPNSGKAGAPVFTHGEVMPIWLGGGWEEGDAVPRIQLIDYSGERKLSIVAGNYFGGLYYIHNSGSAQVPAFHMPQNRSNLQFATHTQNVLWCNYLSPFLYDWSGTGRLDLVVGDGTYSANSIYLFNNTGSNDRPIFSERSQQKIIPGMGREDFTPQVVDWSGQGNADIIAGERTGYVDLYRNRAASKTVAPDFDMDNPQHVKFGATDKIGGMPTVCVSDVNQDKQFDLIVGSADGRILYAQNTGTTGNPSFGALVPLKGTNPYPKIVLPRTWAIERYTPDGAPYELLECVNGTIEPGFKPPPGFKGQGAMRFSIFKPTVTYFKDQYVPVDPTRAIRYTTNILLQAETRYDLSFWVRVDGRISDLCWHMLGNQYVVPGQGIEHEYKGPTMSSGGSWSQVHQQIEVPRLIQDNPNNKPEMGSFRFQLDFQGDGNLYVDDISLRKAN